MTSNNLHQSHADILRRLKRAHGHLRKIIEMIETERSCLDIAQQLHAVEKAVGAAKKTLIHDHLDHCLDEALQARAKRKAPAMDEFKTIAKYL